MKIVYNKIIPFKGFVAINLFGVLFVREEYRGRLKPSMLTHEGTHTEQMKEMLYIFFYLWYFLEWVVRLIIATRTAYRGISLEQEAYDNENNDDNEVTLRDGSAEINEVLTKKLNERLEMAGLEVMEARINYLAYAPEIAAVMLRRQQAAAIITAREKIVDGAVSMVKMALDKLHDDDIVELDDDKKAAMVSNLLVVLCADEPAQPVINSGTLNH